MKLGTIETVRRKSPKSKANRTSTPRERTPNDPLTSEEVSKLIQGADNLPDATLFALGFSTGMRVSEVYTLEEPLVDFKNSKAQIWDEKKNRMRFVFFSEQLRLSLQRYIKEYPQSKRESPKLFPYSAKTIERKIQYWTEKLLGRKKSWHCVRHTYISLSREQEIPMEIVIANTGDSPVTILGVYSRMSPEKILHFINERPIFKI